MQSPPKYRVKTLGCKANLSDSQLLEAELQKRGWVPSHQKFDSRVELCIVNSCTVTDEADRQSRRLASRLAKENPEAKIIFTGCSAEVDPEKMAATPGIHFVVGNQQKHRLIDLVLEKVAEKKSGNETQEGLILGQVQGYSEMRSRHPEDREWPTPSDVFLPPPDMDRGNSSRTRAFLKVQEGCNSFCTYCVIPYGRGPSRSLPLNEVLAQVQVLVAQGFRELVITGTNIGDYGTDLNDEALPQFELLIERILKETSIERLRLSSLDPVEITPRVFELMAEEPRLAPHFHVSLQSPETRVLKWMKRKYTSMHVDQCLRNTAKVPNREPGGTYVGMDLITGFPGETIEDFEAGVARLKALPWTRLHVFPYSERAGTPATRLPGVVPQAERVRRARVLKDLSDERVQAFFQEVAQAPILDGVLFEGSVKGPDGTQDWASGYTRNYARVWVKVTSRQAAHDLSNTLHSVRPLRRVFDPATGDGAVIGEMT